MSKVTFLFAVGLFATFVFVGVSGTNDICLEMNNCTELVRMEGCNTDTAFVNKHCAGICDKCKIEDLAPTRMRAAATVGTHEYDCADKPGTPCDEYYAELDMAEEPGCGANKLMLKLCKETCGICPYEHLCLDRNPKCKELAEGGACTSNQTYMMEWCPLACEKCGADGFCLDNSKKCGELSESGECEKDSTTRFELCPLSCGQCGGFCLDKDKKCAQLALAGQCKTNATYMTENCPVTCGECSESRLCEDRLKTCGKLVAVGDCTKNAAFMTENCPRSCDMCEKIWISKLQKDAASMKTDVGELRTEAITGIRLEPYEQGQLWYGPGYKDEKGWVITMLQNWNIDEYGDYIGRRRLEYRVNGSWILVGWSEQIQTPNPEPITEPITKPITKPIPEPVVNPLEGSYTYNHPPIPGGIRPSPPQTIPG